MLRLDKRYKKDDSLLKVHTLELFETYKRPSNLYIPELSNYQIWETSPQSWNLGSKDTRQYLTPSYKMPT